MKKSSLKKATAEAKLLLIGIPVFLWTMLPIYHIFLFSISTKEEAFAGKLWPDHPTLRNFGWSSTRRTTGSSTSGGSCGTRW